MWIKTSSLQSDITGDLRDTETSNTSQQMTGFLFPLKDSLKSSVLPSQRISPATFAQKGGRLEGDGHHSMDSVSVVSEVLKENFKAILPVRSLSECFPITTCNRCGIIKHGRMSKRRFSCCSHMVKQRSGSIFCLSVSSHLFRYVQKASVGT